MWFINYINCMSKIKLLKIDSASDGTERFQTQLSVGKDYADFIREKDGIMKAYGYGEKGFNFYPYEKPYEIILEKSNMDRQVL